MRMEDGNRNHGIKASIPWRKFKHIIADTDFENYLLHAPDSSAYTSSQNVFMIQLPIKDAAEKALEIIKSNAKKHG